jgi:hypothetical protein
MSIGGSAWRASGQTNQHGGAAQQPQEETLLLEPKRQSRGHATGVHVTQPIMVQRHFALQAVSRSYRRQHALATKDLPSKDDTNHAIAGYATAASLFARTQEEQNGADDTGYKCKRKRWYA